MATAVYARQSQAFLEENRQPTLLAAEVTTRILAFLAVGLRFVARRVGEAPLWWDDWIIFALGIFLIPEFGIQIAEVVFGLGRHVAWVEMNSPRDLPTFAKLAYTSELTYAPVLTPIKCSIICLFLRLFGVRRWFRNLCLALIGMVLVWGLVTFFLFTFQCPTVSDAWSPTGQRPNCMAFSTLFLGTNIPNVIIDVFILSLPIYPIWSLRMPLSKKILISAVLAVGIAEVAISIARVTILSQLTYVDVTWDLAEAGVWSELEVNVGVICSCLPVLAPLLSRNLLKKLGLSAHSSSGRKGNHSLTDSFNIRRLRQRHDGSADAEEPFARDGSGQPNSISHTTDIYVEERPMDGREMAA